MPYVIRDGKDEQYKNYNEIQIAAKAWNETEQLRDNTKHSGWWCHALFWLKDPLTFEIFCPPLSSIMTRWACFYTAGPSAAWEVHCLFPKFRTTPSYYIEWSLYGRGGLKWEI